jgi:hypothetical protein
LSSFFAPPIQNLNFKWFIKKGKLLMDKNKQFVQYGCGALAK